MFKFERSLKLRQHFFSQPTCVNPQKSQFRLKSDFVPPGQFPSITTFIQTVKYDTYKTAKRGRFCPNTSLSERKAILDLIHDNTIIIKPADKGGAIVLMDYVDYRKGILSLLADENSYQESNFSSLRASHTGIKTLVDIGVANSWLHEKEAEYLFDPYPRTPVLYGLPKIHKGYNPLTFAR